MSVPVFKRNESTIEFLHTYHKLRKEVNILIARDFGIKPRTYTTHLVSKIYELSEEDEKTLNDMSTKYGMNSVVIEKYPQWLINSLRTETREYTRHIGVEIELANSIFIHEAISKESYAERRKHWELAIGYCNALKDELNEIVECFHPKASAYEELVKLIDKEIALLKGIRKHDGKTFKNKALAE